MIRFTERHFSQRFPPSWIAFFFQAGSIEKRESGASRWNLSKRNFVVPFWFVFLINGQSYTFLSCWRLRRAVRLMWYHNTSKGKVTWLSIQLADNTQLQVHDRKKKKTFRFVIIRFAGSSHQCRGIVTIKIASSNEEP